MLDEFFLFFQRMLLSKRYVNVELVSGGRMFLMLLESFKKLRKKYRDEILSNVIPFKQNNYYTLSASAMKISACLILSLAICLVMVSIAS